MAKKFSNKDLFDPDFGKPLIETFKQLKREIDESIKGAEQLGRKLKSEISSNKLQSADDVKKLKREKEKVNKVVSAENKLQQQRKRILEQLELAEKGHLQQLEKERFELNKRKKEIRDNIKLNNAADGSLNKLRAQLIKARKEFDNLSRSEGKNSKRARALANQINNLDKQVRELETTTGRHQRNVGNYASAFRNLGKQILSTIGAYVGITAAIGALTRAARSSFNIVREYGQVNADLAAILGVTAEQTGILQEQQKELGATTVFSASQIAQAQKELAKLGQTQEQILATTPGLLSLAAATGEDLATSAEVLAKTLNQFQLDADQSNRVVDVMAKSFSSTALDLEKFNEAMKLAGPIANAAGLEVETTTALIGQLTNAGIQGSLAGTGLRNLLGKLSDSNSELGKSLGFTVNNSESLIRAFKELEERNIDLTEATELSDERSKAAFVTLIQGVDNVKDLEEAFKNAGGAARTMAETQLDTLDGDIRLLNSAWEAAVLRFTEGGNVLRSLTQTLTSFVQVITENSNSIKSFLRIVAIATTGFIAYRVAIFSVNKAVQIYTAVSKAAAFASRLMRTGIRGATVAFKAMNTAMKSNIIGLITGLIATLVAEFLLFRDATDEATEAQERFNEAQKKLLGQQDEINKKFAIRNELSQRGVQDLVDDIEELIDTERKQAEALEADIAAKEKQIEANEDFVRTQSEANKVTEESIDNQSRYVTFANTRTDAEEKIREAAMANIDAVGASIDQIKEEIAASRTRSKDLQADLQLRRQQLATLLALLKAKKQGAESDKGEAERLGLIEELEEKIKAARDKKQAAVSEGEIENQNKLIQGYEKELERLRELGIEKEKEDKRLENFIKKQAKELIELETTLINEQKESEEIRKAIREERIEDLKAEIELREELGEESYEQRLELAKLEQEIADEAAELAEKRLEEEKQRLNESLRITREFFDSREQARRDSIEREIQDSKDREAQLTQLAANGSEEAQRSLALEQQRQAELERERQRSLRRQRNIAFALAGAELIISEARSGSANPSGDALEQLTEFTDGLEGVLNSLPAFEKGGKIKGGEQIVRTNESGEEWVINAKSVDKYGDEFLDQINRGTFDAFDYVSTPSGSVFNNFNQVDFSSLKKDFQELKMEIRKKPVSSFSASEITGGLKESIFEMNKRTERHYRRSKLF